MYPASPTVQQWRAAAAAVAKASGTQVPYWFDGSDAATQRLNVDNHPKDFPDAQVQSARAFLAKNPRPGKYAGQFTKVEYGLAAMTGDFVKEAANTAGDLATAAYENTKDALGVKRGLAAVKAEPKGFALVALTGIALGAGVWFIFGRKGGA
jgi:hypothetical protein